MIARKCDRCGKFYDDYHDNPRNKLKANGIAIVDTDPNTRLFGTREKYDLCPDCMKATIDFINWGKTKDEAPS